MRVLPDLRASRALAVLAAGFLLVLADAAAARPDGPQFGDNRYSTSIEAAAGADVDVYGGDLIEGEALTVRVKALKGSELLPHVEVRDPSGTPQVLDPQVRRGGRLVKVRKVAVTESGRWTVRVSGTDATTGAYLVVFKVHKARRLSLRRERVGGDGPLTGTYPFAAVTGATLELRLKPRSKAGAVRLQALRDPDGDDVAGLPADAFLAPESPRKPLRIKHSLTGRDGTYTVVVGMDPAKQADDGSEAYDVRITVSEPNRPRSRKRVELVAQEPYLDVLDQPVRAASGSEVTFAGGNLLQDPPVRLLFGEVDAQIMSATADSITCVVPAGDNGATVDVAVVSADQQVAVLADAFVFDNLTVQPGSGFTGPTADPGPIGAGPGSDAKAIARWDCVPFQTFDGPFGVGVVAFHINGIDRVELIAEGGPALVVREMTLNPRTGVWQYWASLEAEDFPDGEVEVRAIVYPQTAGIPRVLGGPIDGSDAFRNGNHSLFLSANAGGSLASPVVYVAPGGSDTTGDGTEGNPYETTGVAFTRLTQAHGSADGATVYLAAGTYPWGPGSFPTASNTTRWTTMEPAPGVPKGDVVFDTSQLGYDLKLIRCERLTFSGTITLDSFGDKYLWLDDCEIDGPGKEIDHFWASGAWFSHLYLTDVESHDIKTGLSPGNFIRDCYVHDVSFGAFQGAEFVLNSRCERFDDAGQNFHGDVFHWLSQAGGVENIIVFGLEVTEFDSQGVFAEVTDAQHPRMDNVAFVNVHISKDADSSAGSWWEMSTNHLLLWHCSLPDQVLRWPQSTFNTTVENVSIVATNLWAFTHDQLGPETDAAHIHYTDPTHFGSWMIGTDTSGGDNGYEDEDGLDYRLRSDSPLVGRVPDLLVPVDLHGRRRSSPTAIGARAGPAE